MMRIEPTRRGLLTAAAAPLLSGPWLRQARAAEGGTLTVALSSNPVTCDPINMANHDSQILSQTIWENLVEYDVDGVLRPQLARALPEISADKLVYTFDLRDDVAFSGGQPLSAADVKYSIEYTIDPAHKASRGPIFYRISRVETDGPHRVHVHLKAPYAPWTAFLSKYMGVWPAGSRDRLGDEYFRRSPRDVGTGPGIFEEWKPNDYVSFRRNPNYWQKGLPHWDRLVVKIVPEDASRVAYLLAGQADIIGAPPPRDFARLKTRRGVQGAAKPTLGGWTVMLLNNLRPPFDDIAFRRALSHAIDRKVVAEKVFFGLVEPSSVPAPTSGWWFDQQADAILDYDLDKARAQLARSRYPQGTEFDLLVSSEPYLLDARDLAVYMQAEYAKIGVKVNLKLAESSIVLSSFLSGNYGASLANIMSPGDPTYFIMANFTAPSFMSKTSGINDPVVADLLQQAFAETDQAVLKPIYARLQTHLAEQAYYVTLGFFDAADLWRDRVKNFRVNQGLTITVRDVGLG